MHADSNLPGVAAAIAEPARARMLCCLMDGRARTGTELAIVAQVSPSTASVHLTKLRAQQLVSVVAQGKHRYYRLAGNDVAAALEALLRIAGAPPPGFVPSTPDRLRAARTCYDHMAGSLAVAMHDHMLEHAWLLGEAGDSSAYALSTAGIDALEGIGVDVAGAHKARRRFACACVDWSERRPHVGGALGAALLTRMLERQWLERELDSRALSVTRTGRQQIARIFPSALQPEK